jgi:hypothetical protein
LQSVAPQTGSVVLQAAVQQKWPMPPTPQTPETQTSFEVQGPVEICAVHAPVLQ